jgi:type I restriction enzyme S subunit
VTAGNPAPQGEEFFEGGTHPFVRVQDLGRLKFASHLNETADYVNDKASKSLRLFPRGSILFTKSGASLLLNQRAILGRDMHVVSHIGVAVPGPRIASEWLYYWLRTVDFADIAHGANMPSLPLAKVKKIMVPVPPLEEQSARVAEIEKQFSRLDEAVANLKRVKANLKRYKAAVLKAAVEGRLVETEAELARREGRSYETGAQLLQRILETRRSQWQGKGKYKEPAAPDTTDLPELPEGWGWATVESLSMKVADGVHKKPNYLPEGIPFVTVKNLTAGSGISFDDLNYVSTEDHEEFCKRTHPERGDILISKDGTLGVVRLVETDRPFSVFVSVALIKPVDRNMSRYLVTAFESPTVQRQMVPKGSGLQHIHLEDLRADSIPVPPLAERHRIVAEVDRHLSLLRATEAQVNANLQRAERLRQSILSRAFSGFAS